MAAPASGPDTLVCPGCRQTTSLGRSPSLRLGDRVDVCAVCGHPDFYIQKDFNRALGLTVVIFGSLVSVIFFAMREPFLALGALVAMALIDGAIWLWVPDVTVCYACHAIYRGFGKNPEHGPFNLELLERYGGRTPRR
jgi:hypothetical protein